MPVVATWKKKEEFEVHFDGGETVVLAGVPREERPGPGPSPVDAFQAAVAACTGIDVVLILEKMRQPPERFRIEVSGTRRDEHPRIFTRLVLTYHLDGAGLTEVAVRRAVTLSQEKYCSVSAMIRPTVELATRIVLNGEMLPG